MRDFLITKLRRFLASRTIWAMGDQGMVSLGNFAVNIILARNVSPSDYGFYTLIISVFYLLQGLHGSVVNYPMILKIARESPEKSAQLTGMAITLTAAVMVVLVVGLAVFLSVIDQLPLLFWVALAFVAGRFQEVIRRALMAQLKHRQAALGDAISYLGQAVAMLGILYFDHLSLPAVFLAIAATSALAFVVQFIQVGVRFAPWATLVVFAKECWDLGRWVIMRRVVATAQGQGVSWVLAGIYGVEATASFRAAVNILAVTHPIMQGIGNLVEPSVAHAHKASITRVARVSWKLGLQGAALVFPYYLLLTFLPDVALRLYYGADSPYVELGHIVAIMAVGYSIAYVGFIVGGTLTGLGKPVVAFHAQLFGTASAFAISIPLAALGGIDYAAIGTSISRGVLVAASFYYVRREISRETAELAIQRTSEGAG